MPKLKVADINIHYDEYGRGEPLLMIMGLGASSAAWEPDLVQELAKSFRTITFDNRGTGQSDKPDKPYSIEMFANDAAAVLDGLKIPRAHIFGVSMGGMISQELALRGRSHTARDTSRVIVRSWKAASRACWSIRRHHSRSSGSLRVPTRSKRGTACRISRRRRW
jgi:pimeloyl-ACP methyl ester carboxylesterase